MKLLFSVSFLAALLLPFVSGQSLPNIPQCAQTAAISSLVTTGCAISNYTCFCDDKSWISNLLPVVMKDCDAADFQATVQFAEQLCGSVGVSLSISGVSSPASTPAAAGTTTASSSTMPAALVTSTSLSTPVMSSSTVAASTTSASAASAIATSNSAPGLILASQRSLELAVYPTLISTIFILFGYLI